MTGSRYKKKEIIFFTGYILYLSCLLLTYSFYDYIGTFQKVNTLLRYALAPIFFMLAIIINVPIKRKAFYGFLLVFLFLSFNFIFSSEKSLIMLLLIILSASDIDFEKLMRVSLIVSVTIMAFIILSSLIGFIDNRLYIQDAGTRIRYSLGYGYANMGSKFFLSITLLVVYLKKDKIKIYQIAILLALNFIFYVLTRTRMAFIISFIVLIGAALLKRIKIKKSLASLISIVTVWCVPLSLLLSYFCTLYYKHYKILEYLNIALNQRFNLGYNAILKYGLTLWGRAIDDFVGPKELYDNPALTYDYVDSFYLQQLFKNGLIFIIILCVLFVCLGKKIIKDNNYYLALIIIIMAFHSILEPSLLRISYHPFLLYFSQFFKIKNHNVREPNEQTSG